MEQSVPQSRLVILTSGVDPLIFIMLLLSTHGEKKESPNAKEKRLELEFGKSLSAQGIPVQHQVKCECGIADIVTPDAIYEIKASLSRGNIYRAASQVLLYRNCINPSAKAVIVGYPHDKEPVDIEIANKLGIEIVVCKNAIEAEKQKARKEHEQRIKRIDLDYATSHLICIHKAEFNGEYTCIQGYIEGYAQEVTIIRKDNEQDFQELIAHIKSSPWCNVKLSTNGRLNKSVKLTCNECPCSAPTVQHG